MHLTVRGTSFCDDGFLSASLENGEFFMRSLRGSLVGVSRVGILRRIVRAFLGMIENCFEIVVD